MNRFKENRDKNLSFETSQSLLYEWKPVRSLSELTIPNFSFSWLYLEIFKGKGKEALKFRVDLQNVLHILRHDIEKVIYEFMRNNLTIYSTIKRVQTQRFFFFRKHMEWSFENEGFLLSHFISMWSVKIEQTYWKWSDRKCNKNSLGL